jgi:hypothetical protein
LAKWAKGAAIIATLSRLLFVSSLVRLRHLRQVGREIADAISHHREFSGNEKKSVKVDNSRRVSLRDEFHERAGAV